MVSTHSRPKAAGHEREDRLGRHRRFNTQPPEGGWKNNRKKKNRRKTFQHTAARRRLASMLYSAIESFTFQHTAARRRLAGLPIRISRLSPCFNTQPPEGGWTLTSSVCGMQQLFQHTAARRRLADAKRNSLTAQYVSTHSRPKAAGHGWLKTTYSCPSFNTQPPEGGWHSCCRLRTNKASFNTQPPEGGWHTDLKEAEIKAMFQHTAARRRLDLLDNIRYYLIIVSTHSRPKAAGRAVIIPSAMQ